MNKTEKTTLGSLHTKVRQCCMCAEWKSKLPWRIKLYKRKTLYGEYCTKRCANMDAWGPKFWKSHAHYLPNNRISDNDTA